MSSIKKTAAHIPAPAGAYRLNALQQKSLKLQLNKLDLYNRLVLTLNKKIESFPHNKVSDNMGSSLNQNIVFNFSNKNVNTDRRLINNKTLNLANTIPAGSEENAIKLLRSTVGTAYTDLGPALVKNSSRLGIINNAVKIITSFFKGLSCVISRPQFINKTDKIIVTIFYYQNNFNKDPLFSNNKSNFIYNLFNGTASANAQYSMPKSQNFAAILRDMLGQTKWNKTAQTMFKNNEAINALELANIPKKVFVLFIKDLINLITSIPQPLKGLREEGRSIEKALIVLQKGVPSLVTIPGGAGAGAGAGAGGKNYPGYRGAGLVEIKKYNQLLVKLINSTNSEALTIKRTRLSKTFFNKSLLANLRNKIYKHNNTIYFPPSGAIGSKNNKISPNELIGKGLLLNPVNKKKLDSLLAWSGMDLSDDYKIIANALLVLLKSNDIDAPAGSPTSALANKLTNKINKNLTSFSNQFADEVNKNINFVINKTRPILFKDAQTANTKLSFASSGHNTIKLPQFLLRLGDGNAFNIIKLINKNIAPAIPKGAGSKGAVNTLMVVKEALKAYNYNNNKNGIAASGLISSVDNLNKFKLLGSLLAKIFKKNIDFQLIKLHNVGLESDILSQIIALNARADKTSTLIKKLWRKVNISKASLIHFQKQNNILNGNALVYDPKLHKIITIPAFSKLNNKTQLGVKIVNPISDLKKNITLAQLYDQIKNTKIINSNPLALGKTVGLSLRIAGRLKADPIRPKQTVKKITVGSLSKERSNTSSLSSFTSKNRRGAFRITVKMAHSRTFSTTTEKEKFLSLNPSFVTGFTDGEGCVFISVYEAKGPKVGWSVPAGFQLVAANNSANLAMLNSIQEFFGVGRVVVEENNHNNMAKFLVTSLKDCLIIREHFLNFPLLTYKLVHFQLWSKVIDLMLAKEHLNLEGLLKIVALKAHFKEGLSEKLQKAFPNYKPINCPKYNPNLEKMNIHWIAGFINADGNFGISISKQSASKFGEGLRIKICITQHNRSLIVLKQINKFLGVGGIYDASKLNSTSDFKIQSITGINSFIEQFKEAQLLGAKALDYLDFCEAISLVNTKVHRDQEGLELIRSISERINNKRINFNTVPEESE